MGVVSVQTVIPFSEHPRAPVRHIRYLLYLTKGNSTRLLDPCTHFTNILFSLVMRASENPHLFPDTFYAVPLETWAAAIQRLPSETEQCLIDQVVHHKALSNMEHEFLIVYATHPSGSKIVLGVDRNGEELTAAPNSESESQQASSSSSGPAATTRYFSTLITHLGSQPPPSSSPNEDEGTPASEPFGQHPARAYDSVQVSHDSTPEPILAHHGPSVPLSTISFTSSRAHSSTSEGSSADPSRPPSLLHLSVLLLAIRTHFPSYALLQYQCYFFARATCLALVDLFGGTETEHEEGRRAATWRGVHVSLYSAGRAALQNMLLLPLAEFPALIVPAGLFAVYSVVKLYDGNVVESEVDRRRIR